MTREQAKQWIYSKFNSGEVEKLLADLIIKALEQEPCEDAVSRKAVKDWFCTNYCSEHNQCEHFEQGDCNAMVELFAIPSVNPQKWIPVSERLPNKDRYIDFYKCLVAVSCTSRNTICDSFTAYFDGKHFYRHLYDRAIISEVKAWMPLPEPYKAEREDKC